MEKRILDIFRRLPTPRSEEGRNFRHPGWVILLTTIFALVSGHSTYAAYEKYIRTKQKILRKRLHLPRLLIPSRSTIQRFWAEVDRIELFRVLYWVSVAIVGKVPMYALLHLDGKCIRGGGDNRPYLVNIYTEALKFVINAELSGRHDSERNHAEDAVREALRLTDAKTPTVTGDALHTTQAFLSFLTKNGCHYLFCVKKEHKSTHTLITEWATYNHQRIEEKGMRKCSKGHGRVEERLVLALPAEEILYDVAFRDVFPGVSSIILSIRKVTDMKTLHESEELHVYVTSHTRETCREQLGMELEELPIHRWSIETMHYLLDRHLGDDSAVVRNPETAANLSAARRFALFLFIGRMGRVPSSVVRNEIAAHPECIVRLLTAPAQMKLTEEQVLGEASIPAAA